MFLFIHLFTHANLSAETVNIAQLTSAKKYVVPTKKYAALLMRIRKEFELAEINVHIAQTGASLSKEAAIQQFSENPDRQGTVLLRAAKAGIIHVLLVFRNAKTHRFEAQTLALPQPTDSNQTALFAIKVTETALAMLNHLTSAHVGSEDTTDKTAIPHPNVGTDLSPDTSNDPSVDTKGDPPTPPESVIEETGSTSSSEKTEPAPPSEKNKSPKPAQPITTQSKSTSPPITKDMTERPTFRLHLTVGLGWSPGGIGPTGNIGGGVAVKLRAFLVGISGMYSALSQTLENTDATASFRLIRGGVVVGFMPRPFNSWQPLIGVQGGIGHAFSQGKSDTVPVKTARTTLFYGALIGTLSYRLNQRIAFPISLKVGALAPGVAVRFANHTIATLDVLILDATVGIAVRI